MYSRGSGRGDSVSLGVNATRSKEVISAGGHTFGRKCPPRVTVGVARLLLPAGPPPRNWGMATRLLGPESSWALPGLPHLLPLSPLTPARAAGWAPLRPPSGCGRKPASPCSVPRLPPGVTRPQGWRVDAGGRCRPGAEPSGGGRRRKLATARMRASVGSWEANPGWALGPAEQWALAPGVPWCPTCLAMAVGSGEVPGPDAAGFWENKAQHSA